VGGEVDHEPAKAPRLKGHLQNEIPMRKGVFRKFWNLGNKLGFAKTCKGTEREMHVEEQIFYKNGKKQSSTTQ